MFDDELSKILKISSNDMCKFAKKNCYYDYVDEENGCSWYHSVWAYLRLLDCVSAPQWHEENYRRVIKRSLDGFHKPLRFLISGTADYSMLYLIIDELYKNKSSAFISILDRCPSPIHFCKEYVTKLASEPIKKYIQSKHIHFEYFTEDLLRTGHKNFDIICSDAFLTRFEKQGASSVVDKWYNMLNNSGIVITTVRLHDGEKRKDLLSVSKDIMRFEEKVRKRYDEYVANNLDFPISKKKLTYLANSYIIRMESNNLGNEEDVKALFNPAKQDNPVKQEDLAKQERFELSVTKEKVQGEIEETEYMFIEARKKS